MLQTLRFALSQLGLITSEKSWITLILKKLSDVTKPDKSFSFTKTNKTKQTILFYFKIVVTKLIETQPASSNGYSRRVV